MRIPILTYHSMTISGNRYEDNDHVAFASDIEQVTASGFRVLPLSRIVSMWLKSPHILDSEPIVALTCDDGPDFDFHDLPHPVAGLQRSMLNILRDFRSVSPDAQPELFLTSFAIVSPAARVILDRTCMIGERWWNDDWWPAAVRSGLMGIGNHSWDHNHDAMPSSPDLENVARGTFHVIDNDRLADFQIAGASEYLWKRAPSPDAALFAYPYGEANEFLVTEYFPRRAEAIRIQAAFDVGAEPIHAGSNRWRLPRYVFGRDWRSPADLQRILDEAKRRHAG